jgi:hypothetical protein
MENLDNTRDGEQEPQVTGLATFMNVLKDGINDRLINHQNKTWQIATFLNPR